MEENCSSSNRESSCYELSTSIVCIYWAFIIEYSIFAIPTNAPCLSKSPHLIYFSLSLIYKQPSYVFEFSSLYKSTTRIITLFTSGNFIFLFQVWIDYSDGRVKLRILFSSWFFESWKKIIWWGLNAPWTVILSTFKTWICGIEYSEYSNLMSSSLDLDGNFGTSTLVWSTISLSYLSWYHSIVLGISSI